MAIDWQYIVWTLFLKYRVDHPWTWGAVGNTLVLSMVLCSEQLEASLLVIKIVYIHKYVVCVLVYNITIDYWINNIIKACHSVFWFCFDLLQSHGFNDFEPKFMAQWFCFDFDYDFVYHSTLYTFKCNHS